MNSAFFWLGSYCLLGCLYTIVRWGRIESIGRPVLGDKFVLAVPVLVLIWPFLVLSWISDAFRLFQCAREGNRLRPTCKCGKVFHVRMGDIKKIRHGGQCKIPCAGCGAQITFRAEAK